MWEPLVIFTNMGGTKALVLLAIKVCLISCTLDIYGPKEAKDTYSGVTIGYTVANFGHIPYGKSMIGTLLVVDPLENCNILDPGSTQNYDSAFLLIKRGTCSFVKKVANAQKLGAKMAIIMDNIQQNTGYITMKDDGNGYLINIPSVLISDSDGERLINLTKEHSQVTLRMTFDTAKTQKVNMTIWTESNNRMTYHFVRNFAEYYPQLKPLINLKVIPHTFNCYFCKAEDCISDGKYCSINYNSGEAAAGRDVVKQQIREQIVSKDYPDQWWDYMDQFDQECVNLLQAQACSLKIFKKLSINSADIEAKVAKQLANPQMLSANMGELEFSGTMSYPSVSINNRRYLGNLKASYVFEEICNTLQNPPPSCLPEVYDTSSVSNSHWFVIALVILSAFALFALIFYFYRRRLNKSLSVQMSSQVSQQVSKYIEFYSSRNNQ